MTIWVACTSLGILSPCPKGALNSAEVVHKNHLHVSQKGSAVIEMDFKIDMS